MRARFLCPIRFQGQWEDEETGLYYNRFRYYDPVVGQYTSPDPLGVEGGIRLFGYVYNPSNWIDPSGLNLNSNEAVGNFRIYKIYLDGKIFKVGVADMGRVTQTSGLPTRLHTQMRQLTECYGLGRVTQEHRGLGRIKKKCAKAKEVEEIGLETLKSGGRIPPGNSLSYFAGTGSGAPECVGGGYPRGVPLDGPTL